MTSTRSDGAARAVALLFGVGRVPRAPGTAGTAAAVPVCIALDWFGPAVYIGATVLIVIIGTWAADRTAHSMGTHDHPSIVIDEVAGFLVAMAFVPVTALGLAAGFAAFRLLDIVKPWPIRWFDRVVPGGIGIMLDDLLAGLGAAAISLALLALVFV